MTLRVIKMFINILCLTCNWTIEPRVLHLYPQFTLENCERAIGYNVLFFNRYRKGKKYFNDSHSHYISTAQGSRRVLLTTSEFGYVSGTHATEVLYYNISHQERGTRFFNQFC